MESLVQTLRHIPQRHNLVLSVLTLAFHAATFVLTPLLWAWSGWVFAAYMVVYGYMTVLSWLLIHEAIHFKLMWERGENVALGRALAISLGCPFHILKVGHMTHHRHNRGLLDANELVPPGTKPFGLWWAAYYLRILGGLYGSEVVAPLAFFFWKRFKRLVQAWCNDRAALAMLELFTHRMVQAVQMDAVLCIGFFAMQIWCNWSALTPLVILFLSRAFIVSFYDNAYHYGNDPDDVWAANNLSVPRFYQRMILNHNLHRLHHRYPTASWVLLPEFAKRDKDGFDASLARTIWQQLKGPVPRLAAAPVAEPKAGEEG